MKKLIIAIVLSILLLSFTTPVLAADPPDTQVGVAVVTNGDVDLDVGISAGGDVNITVDGVDFKQTATTAQAAYSRAFGRTNYKQDFVLYWKSTGLGTMVEGQIAELQNILAIVANAEAKLIQGQELTSDQIAVIFEIVSSLRSSMDDEDAKIWDQLMNGAERHISILDSQLISLDSKFTEQTYRTDSSLDNLQFGISQLEQELESTKFEYTNLMNAQEQRFLVYTWIMGGAIVALAVALLLLNYRSRRA